MIEHEGGCHHEISGPVPVVVPAVTRLGVMTRLFTWMTVACLSASVLVSLLAVTWDRNDLRTQIREQTIELTCRAEANTALYEALTRQFVLVGSQGAVLGELVVGLLNGGGEELGLAQVISDLNMVNKDLDDASSDLDAVIAQQRASIVTCVN